MKVRGPQQWLTCHEVMGTATHPWAAAMRKMRVSLKMKIWEKNCTSLERSKSVFWLSYLLGPYLNDLSCSLRMLTTYSLFSISCSTDTSKRWYPFRPSRTESCRNYTDSFDPSKTKGRVCLPPCPEPLLFLRHLLSSLLVGPGQRKSSSGHGLILTWITMELRTLVRLFINTLSLNYLFSVACCLCNRFLYLSSSDSAVEWFLRWWTE